MHQSNRRIVCSFCVVLFAFAGWAPVFAAYNQYGLDMQEIRADEVSNGFLFLQSSNTWLSATPTKPYTNQAAFVLPESESISWARLYVTLWGGTRDYTNVFSVFLNDQAHNLASFVVGGSNDVNAMFQENTNCAYGLGYGVWLISLPLPPDQLVADGVSSNLFITTVDDPSESFDGRQIHITLAAVCCHRRFNNRLTYRFAEGPSDIYRSQAGGTNMRSVAFSDMDTNEAMSAVLWALYTYGDYNQNDRIYLNGLQYGSDDIANKQSNNASFNYVPDLRSFEVVDWAVSNTVCFSVNTNDIPGVCESSLRPHFAALAVIREPLLHAYDPIIQNNEVVLSWAGASGWVYRVEYATDLPGPIWQPVPTATNLMGTNAVMIGTDLSGPTERRFYRIVRDRP